MGYTHYFRRPSTLDALRFSFFVDDVRAIIAALPEGAALPDVGITPDGVTFNGKPPADYETFDLPRVLPLRPRWNDTDEKGPTGEPLVFQCCKTAQRPYDLAVCAVLLRFARHFPGAVVTSDGSPEDWTNALALVARTFPRDPSPIRVIDRRGSGSQLVPHDDPRPTIDAEWRDALATVDALTGADLDAHDARIADYTLNGATYADAIVRSAREARERQIQPAPAPAAPATPGTPDAPTPSSPTTPHGSDDFAARRTERPQRLMKAIADGRQRGQLYRLATGTHGTPAPAPTPTAPAVPPYNHDNPPPDGVNFTFDPSAPLRSEPRRETVDPADTLAASLLPSRRLTLADFKRLVTKHRARLLVLQESDFDGMTDCVETLRGDFAPARPTDRDERQTLGIAGVYLVLGGGDRFCPWVSASLVGIHGYNCCGSFVVAVRRSDLQASAPAPAPAPAPTGDTTTDPRRPSPGESAPAVGGDVIDAAPGVTLRANPQHGGIELHFDRKPAVAVRSDLKSAGWRWSGASSCWYRSDTPDARAFALDVVASFRTSSGTPGTPDALQATPARDPAPRQILTPAGDDDATAVFTDRAAAEAAAAAAMPRRKHDRPAAVASGVHSKRLGRDAWIVCASPNLVLLADGSMHDFARFAVPAPARDPAPRQIQPTTGPDAPTGSRVGQLVAYYSDRANRFARDAADLERPSTQNYTPKRGRQQAVKRHDAANLRRAERAALALSAAWSAVMTSADPLAYERIPAALRAKLSAKHLCAYTRTRGVSNGYYHWADTHEPACTSAPAVALRALVDAFDVNARADDAKRKADAELREKIDALRGLTIDGFFPSPPAVVRRVVDLADLRPGLSVLEPSAGLGDLAEAARAAGCSVRCVEQLTPAVQVLRARGFETIDADFLDMLPDAGDEHFADRRADRVLMNPPFERGAAMKHVLHALKFVKPGGKLVAVLPATVNNEDVDTALTHAPVDDFELSDPVAGAFDTPDAFRRTGVAVRFLTIDRADDSTRADAPARDEAMLAVLTAGPSAPTVDTSDDVDALDDVEDDDACRECGQHYRPGGDGFDGMCPSCADRAELPDDDADATPSTLSSLIATLRARHA